MSPPKHALALALVLAASPAWGAWVALVRR
jgi:hypothetical protein